MKSPLAELIRDKRVIICCGAGGVGKTTTATALALAAARSGRKVLALTIDPSKRLAETLGVERNLKEPVSLPQERLDRAFIRPPGGLETWMLDPQLVSDRTVSKLADDESEASRLKDNRIYQQISRMVAGMQEYTAMEALYGFMKDGRYDLIVLDTPPSRHALDFLDGPRRLERFFDGRIFQLFTPSEEAGFIRKAASKLIGQVLSAVFGEENHRELQEFFVAFTPLFSVLTRNAGDMFRRLSSPEDCAFLLVSAPSSEAVDDALHFRKKTRELGLPFGGFILNRSRAWGAERVMPEASLFGPTPTPVQLSALEKLSNLATLEQAEVGRHALLLDELTRTAGQEAFATALPDYASGANDLEALVDLADCIGARDTLTNDEV